MEFGYFTLQRQPLRKQPARRQPVRHGHHRRGALCRPARHALGLDRRASFQFARRDSSPDLVLAYIAARTKHIRLAPAVTVMPLHHPIRVAEQWATLDLLSGGRVDFAAGRGYDSREYAPFHIDFEDNQSIFDEGMEVIRKLWAADGRISHHGKHYQFEDVRDHAEADPEPDAGLCRLVLQALDRACRAARLRPDRRAVRRRDELRRAASRSPISINETCAKYGKQAGPADVQLLHAFRRQQGAGGRRSARARSATTRNA